MKSILGQLASLHERFNPRLQGAVLLFLRITIGWLFFLSGRGKLRNFEGTKEFFSSLHDFTDQAPFMFLCITLVTLAFGPGKFSLDAGVSRWWKARNVQSARVP